MVPYIAIWSLDWHWHKFLFLLVRIISDRSLCYLLMQAKKKNKQHQ